MHSSVLPISKAVRQFAWEGGLREGGVRNVGATAAKVSGFRIYSLDGLVCLTIDKPANKLPLSA